MFKGAVLFDFRIAMILFNINILIFIFLVFHLVLRYSYTDCYSELSSLITDFHPTCQQLSTAVTGLLLFFYITGGRNLLKRARVIMGSCY